MTSAPRFQVPPSVQVDESCQNDSPSGSDPFTALAGTWWDETGPFAALHHMTPARVAFIRRAVTQGLGREDLTGLRALDVGCGGGLLAEPLARLGTHVTGTDLEPSSIDTARAHAATQGLTIDYRVGGLPDALSVPGRSYDLVIASEVIEHVEDPVGFVADLVRQVKPGGLVILTTLNRTFRSLLLGVVVAERVLGLVPKGLHDWQKFLKPSEVAALLRENGADVGGVCGLRYNPFSRTARLVEHDTGINYLLWAKAAA